MKRFLSVVLVILILFSGTLGATGNSFLKIDAKAGIDWGYSVYISSYGQVVNSITYRGVNVQAKYAPRNQVANYDESEFSCASFVSSFYSKVFGIGVYNLWSGETPLLSYGSGYFYRTSTPMPGDIAANSQHWAIVKSVSGNRVYLVEQNAWMDEAKTTAAVNRSLVLPENSYWFWHYSGNYGESAIWYENFQVADIGSQFYATISKSSDGKNIGQLNNNVELTGNTNSASEVWYFVRQSDGTYLIRNCANNKVLTAVSSGVTEGTNVNVSDYAGTDNQKWYIYKCGNSYVLRAKHSGLALDVNNADSAAGTNIQLWSFNGSAAQFMNINECEAIGKPTITTMVSDTQVKLSWDNVKGAAYYVLNIYRNSTASGSPYITKELTTNSYTLTLPVGKYSAVLVAYNEQGNQKSEVKTFAVEQAADDGWTYVSSLPSGITSQLYDVEYKNIYSKVSATSPGSDWTKGAVAKTEYANKGEVYYSAIPLETSSTRVLVDYSYYHYCGGSTGDEVNYEATSVFNHFDGISKDNVYEFYSHADYADSRYTFYGLKYNGTDSYVYCKSGTTCDGAWGSHGNRSYYWYKQYAYQDKVAVPYYTYTKESSWGKTKDGSATSVKIRYKKKADATAPENLTATASTSAVTLNWSAVKSADVYSLYQKASGDWKYIGATKNLYGTIKNLKAGTKYTFAVLAGTTVNGKIEWKEDYTVINTATKAEVPKNISVQQNTSTVKLMWNKCEGADGYRVYQKTSSGWKNLGTTSNLYGTIKNLKAGTKYTFAVKPYIKTESGVVWSSYVTVTTATKPEIPTVKASSTSKGKVTVKWNAVNGAEGYQLYYKKGDGSYKLYKTYNKAGTFNFSNLKSGTNYTFAVRAVIKTSAGNVRSGYQTAAVKIK